MNFIKKTALICAAAIFFGASSTIVTAEEVAAVATAAPSPALALSTNLSSTIAHVEQGLAEVQKSDFAAANLHLKAAVESSAKIAGNEALVKEASANVVQGNIQSKQGEVEKSSEFLNNALALYKSI